jgi:TetR/AcrR family transcriptional regulator
VSRSSKATSSTRSPQKPRQARDPEATKAQILNAAEEEFARHGLSGARMEAIAAGTGVTKAMIYYYFENKEQLYQAVLQRPANELLDAIKQLPLDELAPEKALEMLVRGAIAHEASHPYQQMILFQEASQNRGKYFAKADWQAPFAYLLKILERGMADGTFRPVDPWLTAINIAGVCNFYFTTYDNVKHIAPDWDFRNPAMVERHTQEAIAFILAGVRRQTEDR